MTSLIEMLAGAPSPGPIIEAAKLGARFWKGPPATRLLTLLHHDFGKRAGLSRDRFWAWQTDEGLMEALAPVLSGAAVPGDQTAAKLAELIAVKLTETDLADRHPLAMEIAQAALMAPTSVLRTEEKTSYLVEGSQRDGRRLAEVQETVERTNDGISRVLRSLGAGTEDVVVRALIADPLRHAGVEVRAEQAAQYADGGLHREAAEELLAVAEALRSHGVGELAEAFAIRAAESLTSAGQLPRARDLLVDSVWVRLDQGRPASAYSLLSALQSACGPEDGWIADAVGAEVDWPELDDAAEVLAEAAGRTTEGARRARWWAAWAVERTVVGALDELAAEPMANLELGDGPGACIARMLALAAGMRLSGGDLPDDFVLVEDWADRASDESAGTVWSLRACSLAVIGDERGAVRAYRRAMTRWARSPRGSEQTGQLLLCAQAVQQLFCSRIEDLELRPLALALRGPLGCPASVIARLESAGSSEMLDEDWPDARRLLSHAYALAIASGDLQSTLILEGKLARLYAATGHPQAALPFALRAGNGKLANTLAASLPGTQVADALLPGGAPWQRTATYSVVAEHGVRLPPAWIAAHTPTLMSDVGGPLAGLSATPAALAPQAVSAVLHSVPEDLLDSALTVVRDELANPFVGPCRAAAKALQLITDLGRSDETTLLVDELLALDSQARVQPEWVHDRLDRAPELRQRIVQAAVAGTQPALEVLMYDDTPPAEVARAMQGLVGQFVETTTVERSADGRELSVGIGVRFELAGMAARHVDHVTRARLVQRLLQSAQGPDEAAANRASALCALFNVAPVLGADEAQPVFRFASAIASGDVPRSSFDGGPVDPLSRFRISVPGAEDVQVAAVELVGRLQGLGHGQLDVAQEAVGHCVRHPSRVVLAAALRAECWLTQSAMPAPLIDLLRADDVGLRRAAVVLWRHLHPGAQIPLPEREQLLADPHPALRALLADIAAETSDGELLELMTHDEDVRVRHRASSAATADEGPP